MIQTIKAKIIELIENNAVSNESAKVAKQHLESIRSSHFQGIADGHLEPDRVREIYEIRLTTLQMSGRNHEGLKDLLSALRKIDHPIKIAQFVGSHWNTTIFFEPNFEKVIGLIAIEP